MVVASCRGATPPALPPAQQKAEDAQRLARILLEIDEVLPETARGKPLTSSADGHRDDRRRGFPMIGRGVSGATNDTDPVRALLAKESWRRPRRA